MRHIVLERYAACERRSRRQDLHPPLDADRDVGIAARAQRLDEGARGGDVVVEALDRLQRAVGAATRRIERVDVRRGRGVRLRIVRLRPVDNASAPARLGIGRRRIDVGPRCAIRGRVRRLGHGRAIAIAGADGEVQAP